MGNFTSICSKCIYLNEYHPYQDINEIKKNITLGMNSNSLLTQECAILLLEVIPETMNFQIQNNYAIYNGHYNGIEHYVNNHRSIKDLINLRGLTHSHQIYFTIEQFHLYIKLKQRVNKSILICK